MSSGRSTGSFLCQPAWPCVSDVGHADAGPFHEQVRYDRAVAGGVVALEAEQAAASPGREGCQAREVLLRGLGGHVLGEDAVQLGPVSGARGDPARLRGAESAEVDVADAARIERGGQQGLGEAGLAGLRDGADVDQEAIRWLTSEPLSHVPVSPERRALTS